MPTKFRKHFTVSEANKTLPLVRAIVKDLIAQLQVVEDLRQRLARASSMERPSSAEKAPQKRDFYYEEVAQTETQLEQETLKLKSFVRELHALGVEFKGADGLCDFPSLRDGREVYLCWRFGEPEVRHWHEIDGGFAGRQLLADDASSASGLSEMKV